MSSKPSPAGVEIAIDKIETITALNLEIAELQPKADRLKVAEEERTKVYRELIEHMRSMDLESQGNYGWEHRMSWFLGEFLRQAKGAK